MSYQDARPINLDALNLVANTLNGLAVSAQVQGNISEREMKKMSDDIPQLFNIRDRGSLVVYLKNYAKRHPISFSACELMIHQIINS